MPLFGHRENLRRLQESGVPGLSGIAVRQGWEPVPGSPFAGLLEADIQAISRVLPEVPPGLDARGGHRADDERTAFSDAYRGTLDGRTVLVANAWAGGESPHGVAVCAVELRAALTLLSVQPRRFPAALALRETATGDPAFDTRFLVQATADLDGPVTLVLTSGVQQRMLTRDDWFFRAGRGLLGCVTPGPFRTVGEVSQRISEVLAIAAAMPAPAGPVFAAGPPLVMAAPVSHEPAIPGQAYLSPGSISPADLPARLSQLASLDEALDMLATLSPAEHDVLAGLVTPLAALAGVRTPQEATVRYRTLDPQVKLQLAAMFIRPGDPARRR
jgi:hypothetical protein